MKKIKIYPSLLCADVLNLAQVIAQFEPHCDGFHIDVMDNHFVPNLTWGPIMVNAIAQQCTKELFVHLMVDDPSALLERLQLKAGSIVAFHVEVKGDVHNLIQQIHNKGWVASLAISPTTPVENIVTFLDSVDQVLLMSVEPGFSGQQFLHDSITRLQKIVRYKKEHKKQCAIAMDGGINEENILILTENGCEIFVIGSAIFSSKEPIKTLKRMYGGFM